jgi:nicotinate (nicotinamide) nucleotide adenylyltransferase
MPQGGCAVTKVLLALEFLYRGAANPPRVALFPGAWNPPTVAHVEIARAARVEADEVIWVLPRAFPHKDFEGAGFEARCRMLTTLTESGDEPGFSAAVSDAGLYIGIADEAREFFGREVEIALVCGRDAAERMATWDYGVPGVFDELLRRYRLLVAARQGEYEPAGHHSDRIARLPMEAGWDEVSSSEVRRRIANGENWRKLVPPALAGMIEDFYCASLF